MALWKMDCRRGGQRGRGKITQEAFSGKCGERVDVLEVYFWDSDNKIC